MTLILGGKDADGSVWMGADTRASNGESYFDGNDKLIRQHNYVVGVSGSFRVLQILSHSAKRFKPIKSKAGMFRWVNTLRELLADYGYADSPHPGDPEHENVWLLVGTPAALYVVFGNYEFHEHDLWGIGSGWQYGLGYLQGLGKDAPLALRITEAIAKTAEVNPTVSTDAHVVRVEGGA